MACRKAGHRVKQQRSLTMTGYSFNRVRTAALKSMAAMQDRLENIAADFGDVDHFLVGEAEQCRDRLAQFAENLTASEDPTDGSRAMEGHTLRKVRTRKLPKASPAPDPQAELF
jgi:hypothetical protein